MQVVGAPLEWPAIQRRKCRKSLQRASASIGTDGRESSAFAFYEAAKGSIRGGAGW